MNTDLIPKDIHAYIDYSTSVALMALPLMLSGKKMGAETYVPMALGATILLQSLFTDYKLGAKKKMSMKQHLNMDYIGGALLAASPFIFGFRKKTWVPHLLTGASEIAIALLTSPSRKK